MKRSIFHNFKIAKNGLKIFSVLGLALILISCEKEDKNNQPAEPSQDDIQVNNDVREKYVGDFQISLHYSYSGTGTSTGPVTTNTYDTVFITSVYYNKQDSMKIALEPRTYPQISFNTINRPAPMYTSLGLDDSTGNLYSTSPRVNNVYIGGFINPDSINFVQSVNDGRDRRVFTKIVGRRIK